MHDRNTEIVAFKLDFTHVQLTEYIAQTQTLLWVNWIILMYYIKSSWYQSQSDSFLLAEDYPYTTNRMHGTYKDTASF